MFQIMYYAGLALTLIFLVLSIVFFVKNNVAKLIGDVTGWNARKAIKVINKKGAEEKSKTQAIKSDVSKVLVRDEGSSEQTQNPMEKKTKRSTTETVRETENGLGGEPAGSFQVEEDMVVLADSDEEVTTLLETGDEATAVLAEEETTLLETGEEETTVLAEEETTLLQAGEEETTVLAEEETTLLQAGDEETTVLTEQETVMVADGSNSILNQVMDYSTMAVKPKIQKSVTLSADEQIPIPDIFEVEEDATVVHTDESIE